MAFLFPELIRKDADLETLTNQEVGYWHEKMHVLWSKIEEGISLPEWNLYEVFIRHAKLLEIMKSRNLKHLTPINSLDFAKED